MRQPKTSRQLPRNGLRTDPDLAPNHSARLPDLVVDVLDDVARDREADPLAAAGLGEDEGVDADHPALDVDERAAAVARVDRRVGLDVDHRVFRADLPRGGAHHTEAHGIGQTQGATKRHHHLSRL